MKLNWLEKAAMNSPFRAMAQRKEAANMLRLGGPVEGGRVLEIGCGRGTGTELILELFRPAQVEAFDFDEDQTRRARKRLLGRYGDKVRLHTGDAARLASPDATFDAVFDFGVLHHVPDNAKALAEIARVLKPNGRFFFMEILSSLTMHPVMQLLLAHPPEGQFSWNELHQKIQAAGLSVREDACAVSRHRALGVARKRE